MSKENKTRSMSGKRKAGNVAAYIALILNTIS